MKKTTLLSTSLLLVLTAVSAPVLGKQKPKKSKKIVVTTTKDHGKGSLRNAIMLANASAHASTICFDIGECEKGYNPCSKSWRIVLDTALPVITSKVVIDGYSQECGCPNENSIDDINNAHIAIELSGPGLPENTNGNSVGFAGLTFGQGSDCSTLKGVAINGFYTGVKIAANRVHILGNFFGVAPDGYTVKANVVSLHIDAAAEGTEIGDGSPEAQNIIGGLGFHSNEMAAALDNTTLGAITNCGNKTTIKGNTLNLTRDGFSKITSEAQVGIFSKNNSGTTIGGHDLNCRVVVAGFAKANILFDTTNHDVFKNVFAGTDTKGCIALGGGQGIVLTKSEEANGFYYGEESHLIDKCLTSGNSGSGIVIGLEDSSSPVKNTLIKRTKSGTDITGKTALPNGEHGLLIGNGANILVCKSIINFNGIHGLFAPKGRNIVIKDSDVSFNQVDGYNYIPESCLNSEENLRAFNTSLNVTFQSGYAAC